MTRELVDIGATSKSKCWGYGIHHNAKGAKASADLAPLRELFVALTYPKVVPRAGNETNSPRKKQFFSSASVT